VDDVALYPSAIAVDGGIFYVVDVIRY